MAREPGAPPGGHLEFGESPEACAIREAKEKTGVDIVDVRFLAITNDIFPEGQHHVTVWMAGTYWSGEAVIAEPDKASDVGWFTWESLPAPRFLSFDNLLAQRSYPAVHLASRSAQ
jgi:8-oxo-dGTP diphosphatase